MRFELTEGPQNKTLKLSVLDETEARPELIGDTVIPLEDVLRTTPDQGYDEWHPLSYRGKYAGEVYLELTWYSLRPALPPKLKLTMQYGQDQQQQQQQQAHAPVAFTPGASTASRPLPEQPGARPASSPSKHPRMAATPPVPPTPIINYTGLPKGIKYAAGPQSYPASSGPYCTQPQSPSRPVLPYPVSSNDMPPLNMSSVAQALPAVSSAPSRHNGERSNGYMPEPATSHASSSSVLHDDEALEFFSTPLPELEQQHVQNGHEHEYDDFLDYASRGSVVHHPMSTPKGQAAAATSTLMKSTSSSDTVDDEVPVPNTPVLGHDGLAAAQPHKEQPRYAAPPAPAASPTSKQAGKRPVRRKPISSGPGGKSPRASPARKPASTSAGSGPCDDGESQHPMTVFSPDDYYVSKPPDDADGGAGTPGADELDEATYAPQPVFLSKLPKPTIPRQPGDLIDPGLGHYQGEGQWDLSEELNGRYLSEMAVAETPQPQSAPGHVRQQQRRKPRVPPKIPVGMTREEYIASEYSYYGGGTEPDDGIRYINV